MSSFSIIIPMLGSQQDFEATLGSVLRYRLPKHQIVVVHNRDECDPYGLAEEVDFVQCDAGVSLATLIPRGVERATGEVIQILRPGMEVTENWFIHGIRLMLTDGVAAVSPTIRGAEDSHKILATGVNVDFGFFPTGHLRSKIQNSCTHHLGWILLSQCFEGLERMGLVAERRVPRYRFGFGIETTGVPGIGCQRLFVSRVVT